VKDISGIIREFKSELEKLYNGKLKNVILYGSWARDNAREDSDIDFAVVLKGKNSPGKEIDRMIDIVTKMNLKYDVLVSVYPVSESDYLTLKSPLLLNVRREGVPA